MSIDLAFFCAERCRVFSISKNGEVFVGSEEKCKNCHFLHEKTILLNGVDHFKISFYDLKKLFSKIKEGKLTVNRNVCSELKVILDNRNTRNNCRYNEDMKREKFIYCIFFLQFCINNKIFKEWCLYKIKKVLEERFNDES